jgi:hypothetical protein
MFVGLVTFLTVGVSGQIKKGKTRAITTKQLMVGLVKPQCGGLGESLKSAPTDDKMWGELAIKAALLNEISYNLMEDGRCPDKDWAAPRIDPDIRPSLRSRFTKRSKKLAFQSSRPDRLVVLSVPRYGKSA